MLLLRVLLLLSLSLLFHLLKRCKSYSCTYRTFVAFVALAPAVNVASVVPLTPFCWSLTPVCSMLLPVFRTKSPGLGQGRVGSLATPTILSQKVYSLPPHGGPLGQECEGTESLTHSPQSTDLKRNWLPYMNPPHPSSEPSMFGSEQQSEHNVLRRKTSGDQKSCSHAIPESAAQCLIQKLQRRHVRHYAGMSTGLRQRQYPNATRSRGLTHIG